MRLPLKRNTLLAIVAGLLVAAGGVSIALAAFSIGGSSSASATAAPTAATFPSAPNVAGAGTDGSCSLSSTTSFSCSGTGVTEGNSYVLSGTITDPNAGSESSTLTYTNTGSGWVASCTVNGLSVSSGNLATLSSGSNTFSCTITAPFTANTDSFSFSLSG